MTSRRRTGRQLALDLAAGLFFLLLCLRTINHTPNEPSAILMTLLLLMRQGVVAIFFLLRHAPLSVSNRPIEWIVAVAGTFVTYLYQPSPVVTPSPVTIVLAIVCLIALVTSVFAITNLGVSFGLVPANRGIKTTGFYRIARHPIYGLYFIQDLARILMGPTSWNLAVFVVFFVLICKRADYEESHLIADPTYCHYMEEVRWRFVPGLA